VKDHHWPLSSQGLSADQSQCGLSMQRVAAIFRLDWPPASPVSRNDLAYFENTTPMRCVFAVNDGGKWPVLKARGNPNLSTAQVNWSSNQARPRDLTAFYD